MKHKTPDYKTSVVKYYLNSKVSMDKVCKIFDCKKSTLKDWVHKYKNNHKNLTRKNKQAISYKVKKDQVKTALNILDKNEQYTMSELSMILKEKYKEFDISPQHLGRIMRNHNRTRKRTWHEHFPDERRKTPTDKEQELNDFYNTVKKYPMDKITSLDKIKPENYRNYFQDSYGRKHGLEYSKNHQLVNVSQKNIKNKLYML